MSAIVCTFDRIGRTHNPAPLTLKSEDFEDYVVDEEGRTWTETFWDRVAEAVETYAKRFLMSADVQVLIYQRDDDSKHGTITVGGFRNAGRFDVEELK